MTEQELAAIKGRCEAATSGPWRWNLDLKSKRVVLESVCHGFEIIMDFVRWGMGGARPRFRDRDDRGLMTDAEHFACVVKERAHHQSWFQGISQPDADFIAAARTDIPALVAEVEKLRALLAELREQYPSKYGHDATHPYVVGLCARIDAALGNGQ